MKSYKDRQKRKKNKQTNIDNSQLIPDGKERSLMVCRRAMNDRYLKIFKFEISGARGRGRRKAEIAVLHDSVKKELDLEN